MSTYIIGFHDGWMHHPVAAVVADTAPALADPKHDWVVTLTDGDVEEMAVNCLGPLDYFFDLAYSGDLTHVTGRHEPYMDGSPRWDEDEDVQRMWREMGEE